jgi:hypothetical protein
MKKEKKRSILPDLTEFTDENGKKWVQTSTEDLFSLDELNSIIETIDKEKGDDEIILARIDFQKVNREYHEAATRLQMKLEKQTELLRRVIRESKEVIDRKNKKLKELIDYIKKLHQFLAYLNSRGGKLDKIQIPEELFRRPEPPPAAVKETPRPAEKIEIVPESIYEEVEESVV